MPLVNSVATQGSNPAHSAEITIRLTAWKDKHIFKLKLNQMNINKINDIKVHDFVELSPSKETMRAIEIAQAKRLLRSEGYFVDSLWSIDEVTMNYKCTEEQAHIVLLEALTDDGTEQQVYEMIHEVARIMNLKSID